MPRRITGGVSPTFASARSARAGLPQRGSRYLADGRREESLLWKAFRPRSERNFVYGTGWFFGRRVGQVTGRVVGAVAGEKFTANWCVGQSGVGLVMLRRGAAGGGDFCWRNGGGWAVRLVFFPAKGWADEADCSGVQWRACVGVLLCAMEV